MLIGVLWFLYLILSLLMIAVVAFLLGYDLGETTAPQNKFAEIAAVAILIKEIVLLFKLPFRGKVEKYKTADRLFKQPAFGIYDVILLLFGSVAYSSLLDTMLFNAEIDKEQIVFHLFAFLLIFTILYLPMRFAYVYPEYMSIRTRKDFWRAFISFFLFLAAVYLSKFIYPMMFTQ